MSTRSVTSRSSPTRSPGRPRRIEHWSSANAQGAHLADSSPDRLTAYDVVPVFFTQLFTHKLQVLGDVECSTECVLRGSIAEGNAAQLPSDRRARARRRGRPRTLGGCRGGARGAHPRAAEGHRREPAPWTRTCVPPRRSPAELRHADVRRGERPCRLGDVVGVDACVREQLGGLSRLWQRVNGQAGDAALTRLARRAPRAPPRQGLPPSGGPRRSRSAFRATRASHRRSA